MSAINELPEEREAQTEKNRYNFSRKLHQESVIAHFKGYIEWQRKLRAGKITIDNEAEMPKFGPISINFDLTTGCNYRCPYCVDIELLNSGKKYSFETIQKTIDTLVDNGLKSVILIGGGEPTVHRDFGATVKYLTQKGLQIGIVSNGGYIEKIIEVASYFKKGDWVRFSLDAGTDKTFLGLHLPKNNVNLTIICQNVSKLREANQELEIGFSYIVAWEGIVANGVLLPANIDEMPIGSQLAKQSGFNYITFKPCMLKLEDRETLTHTENEEFTKNVLVRIKNSFEQAKQFADENFRVIYTKNLQALFDGKTDQFKSQPHHCHMQIFRQVVTPNGVYHCPAYRGFEKAKVGEADGFASEEKFASTVSENYKNLVTFDAKTQCANVVCFYNEANNWIEDFIESGKNIDEIDVCENDNFFL
ncbi:MAG: radical SAM protein [Parcubacteria group bacterium]|nr:radical SAM protein [Parcubacteria group bacterium]